MKNFIVPLRRLAYSIITLSFLLITTSCSHSEKLLGVKEEFDKKFLRSFESCCIYRKPFSQGDIKLSENYAELAVGMTISEVTDLIGLPQAQSLLNKNRHEHLYQNRVKGFNKTLKTIYAELSYSADGNLLTIDIITNDFIQEE